MELKKLFEIMKEVNEGTELISKAIKDITEITSPENEDVPFEERKKLWNLELMLTHIYNKGNEAFIESSHIIEDCIRKG